MRRLPQSDINVAVGPISNGVMVYDQNSLITYIAHQRDFLGINIKVVF